MSSDQPNMTHQIPAPIGGIPLPLDFAPSILFSILYAAVFIVIAWRVYRPDSRCFLLVGSVIGALERVVFFALRAYAAQHEGLRANRELQVYFQTTLAAGFITHAQLVLDLLRSLLAHPRARPSSTPAIATSSDIELNPRSAPGTEPDYPQLRYYVRQACGLPGLVMLGAVVLGIDGSHAALVRGIWYASAGIALGMLVWIGAVVGWAVCRVPRVPRWPIVWLASMGTLAAIVAIYRLGVLHCSTPLGGLESTASCSGNTPGEKAEFWIFHVAPEFLIAALLAAVNARQMFGTGLWGDIKGKDPKPVK
ncbi:uncharacterized protein BXZ73DRAFT_82664 [Epithele typhae]|uniref:uncharacterized protein n=1 Tax=Epithele typhae TaxID=378194 RepID=UPI002008CAF9|nr:uncharacterized protein BXZ73DRAFT_82664 [Epithele typhae]KAH9911672.1 hypothetical protein BXZ73DRAFT_82664 [Epithele typhae]